MRTSIGGRIVLVVSLVLAGSGPARAQIGAESPLTLNEIDSSGGVQFIELHNRSVSDVPLGEYSLEIVSIDGQVRAVAELPEVQLEGPGFFVAYLLEDEGDECPAEAGTNAVCLRFLDRNLCHTDMDRDGGRVGLRWRKTTEIESVRYTRTPFRSMSYGRNESGEWCLLFEPSAGAANHGPCLLTPRVVLNEISTAETWPDCSFDDCPDWVEIRWLGGPDVDLSQEFALIDRGGEEYLFDDPVVDGLPNPILSAGNPRIIVLLRNGERLPGWSQRYFHAPFGLKAEGDSLSLFFRADPLGSYDSVSIPRMDGRQYLSRVPDGSGAWRINDTASPGEENRATGKPGGGPEVRIIDRFPLRVFCREGAPAGPDPEPIEVFARAIDPDDEIAVVELIIEGPGHPATGTTLPMEPGRAVTCEGDDPERERGVFVARIDRPIGGTCSEEEEEVELVVRVRARDRSGQSGESEPHKVFIQARDWNPADGTQHLRINEVAADEPAPGGGDWLELYNPTDRAIDAGGLFLTNDILTVVDSGRRLPRELILRPGEFRRVWCDGRPPDPRDPNPHLPFVLDACRDEVILLHSDERHVIDVISFHKEKSGVTLGRFPDGADVDDQRAGTLALMIPSPERPNQPPHLVSCVDIGPPGDTPHVVINEVIADNWASGADARGESGDWIELYNPTDETVWLDGWTLWDRGIEKFRLQEPWSFPPGSRIAPRCFLLIWCDDDEKCEDRRQPGTVFCEDPSGELHTNFAISREFDYVQLRDSCNQIVDCVTVRLQARDVAAGRFPDGGGEPALLVPTPGAPNVLLERAGCEPGLIDDEDRGAICRFRPPPRPCVTFKRGDATGDCALNLTDAIFLLQSLFQGGPAPTCDDAADANDDGAINISDPVFVLNFLFSGGPAPTAPGPNVPGRDPTGDRLRCVTSGCN